MSDNSRAVFDACQVSNRIYAFNPRFRRQNFYSQQLRALALVEEFVERGWVEDGAKNYVVLGAGIAGITTAAALLTVGANVRLVSPAEVLAHYADATHRELHPNIIYWPFREPKLITDLPFLNWACGTADRVSGQLRKQWDHYFRNAVEKVSGTVAENGVEEIATGVTVRLTNNRTIKGHRVVLATGFARERSEEAVPFLPYFGGGVTRADGEEIFVSGSGDGGLIDTAYQLYGTAAVTAARVLAYAVDSRPLKGDIEKAESDALLKAQVDLPNKFLAEQELDQFYSNAIFDEGTVSAVSVLVRDQPRSRACLVHESPTPYDAFAAPANKALLALNLQHNPDRVRVKHARLKVVDQHALLEDLDDPAHHLEPVNNLNVVVRHGAPFALEWILSDAQREVLRSKASPLFMGIIPDGYDVAKFGPGAPHRLTPLPGTLQHRRDLADILGVLAAHLQLSGTSVTTRVAKGLIELDFLSPPSPDILAMFPLAIDGVSIVLKVQGHKHTSGSRGHYP